MLLLRPFIKDTVRAELSDFKVNIEKRLSTIEGRFEEWRPLTQKIADTLFRLPSSPDVRRQQLLEKWKQGTLSYQESIELRDILAIEAEQAEENKKALLTLALIALFIYALSRK